jgi:NADP-reducing hydrogenase subunit HndB
MNMTLEKVREVHSALKDSVGERPASAKTTRILVGMATCGMASGAGKVMTALKGACASLGLDNVELVSTGCIGLCQYEPIVEVLAPGQEKVTYVKMTAEKAEEVARKHLQGGKVLGKYTMTYADEVAPDNDEAPVTALANTDFYK